MGGSERSSGALPTSTLTRGAELKQYDRGSCMNPWKPSLCVVSRLPSASSVEVTEAVDARKSGNNHKKVRDESIPSVYDWALRRLIYASVVVGLRFTCGKRRKTTGTW